MKNREWLIIVDYQNDFWHEKGSLYVKWWELILPYINNLILEIKQKSWIIISTQDWHPENHNSFAKTHWLSDFSNLNWDTKWPVHCVKNTWGADFLDWLNTDKIDHKLIKWFEKDVDSYSWFGWIEEKTWKTLKEILVENNIKLLNIVWLATEYCDKATVLDAISNWFDVKLHTKWIAWVNVNPEDSQIAINEMKKAWAKILP